MASVYKSAEEAAAALEGPSAITIGNFDGVHLGHRTLIRQTAQIARSHGWSTGVLTFDPHPTTVVAPERAPRLICTIEERVRLLSEAGADWVLLLPFTLQVANMSGREFIQTVVGDALNARATVVGQNFRFGHQQLGDTTLLSQLGAEFGFECHFLAPITNRGEVVSSTAVRRHIAAGAVARAGRLLGRCFGIEGEVVSGRGVGSRQTVPTLNLQPPDTIIPGRGVHITETQSLDEAPGERRQWQSITNVGVRPTFGEDSELSIETFLLTPFDGVTPKRIRVSFRHWLRDERAFPDPQSLRAQIVKDVSRADAYWRRLSRLSQFVRARQ